MRARSPRSCAGRRAGREGQFGDRDFGEARAKRSPTSPLAGEVAAKQPEGGSPPAAVAPVASAPVALPPSAASGGSSPTRGEVGERTFASPLARRIAKDAGVDVAAITGSGPKGRVVKADVDAAIAGGGAKAAPAAAAAPSAAAPAAAPKGMSDDQVLKLFAEGSYELVAHDGMRKTIAKRLAGIQANHSAFLCLGRLRTRRAVWRCARS